jgi:hypothetical protein
MWSATGNNPGRASAWRESITDFDSPWKDVIDRFFEPFMAFFFPQAQADIDWSRNHEMLDKELQKIIRSAKQGRRYVDELVKV